jgi:hypothetical protein
VMSALKGPTSGLKTMLRLTSRQEAIIARCLRGHGKDFLDSLHVMETAMRHFYVKAIVASRTMERPM